MTSIELVNKFSDNEVVLPNTQKYAAILGLNPSSGARSPKLWNAAFERFSIDCEMIAIDVSENNLDNLLKVLESDINFIGGAIAVPHKESAAEFCGENLTLEAKNIGSINCLYRNVDGFLFGTNTDGEGSLRAFESSFGAISSQRILIMGAGGTGKAVAAYFVSSATNVKQVSIVSRSDSALRVAKRLNCEGLRWSSIDSIVSDFDIIINCTSLGSTLFPNLSPLSKSQLKTLRQTTIIYDVVYDPDPTKLLIYSSDYDLRVLNGKSMNFEQAVLGFYYASSNLIDNLSVSNIRDAMVL